MPSSDHESGNESAEALPQMSTILVMLALFGLVGVIALFTIISERASAPLEVTGRIAYGPADFADEIDWKMAEHAELVATAAVDDKGVTAPFPVPPPPLNPETYPCSDCHDPEDEIDMEPHKLGSPHRRRKVNHGSPDRWCFDCHNPVDRDRLRLVDGTLIGFEESYRLCGQCHGTTYRDWRQGIHGRRIGDWNGRKTYFLCVHCHDPHSPKFQPLAPLPPPIRPRLLATRRTSPTEVQP